MSIPAHEKIDRIRAAERLTLAEFSEKIGVSANTLNTMKSRGSSPRFDVIEKILNTWPQYALWLTTGEIDISSGQIAPGNIADEDALIRYKIIDRVDARYMDKCIVKDSAFKKLVFIQNKQRPSDLAALLLVDQDIFYEISSTPNFRNAVWVSAGNINFESDGGGKIALREFRFWLSNVNVDLIKTAEYWLMREDFFDDVYKALLVPVISFYPPDKSAFTYERFELWKAGNAPYGN